MTIFQDDIYKTILDSECGMGRLGALGKIGRWTGKWIGLPGLVLATAFHAETWIKQGIIEHAEKDARVRKQFKEEFGFPLQGMPEQVEVPGRVAELSNALAFMDAKNISAIKIISSSYFDKPWYRQAEQVSNSISALFGNERITYASSGRYIEQLPLLPHNQLELEGQNPVDVVIHEIGHAKINQAMKDDPSFKDRWMDASGVKTSFYQPIGMQARFYLSFVDVPENPKEQEAYNKVGFTSKASTMHWKEDAADLVANGERAMLLFVDAKNVYGTQFIGWLDANRDVAAQVKVLEDAAALPPEFSEGIALEREYREALKNGTEAADFLKKSGSFLKEHPKTKYALPVRNARARIYWELGKVAARSQQSPWPNQQAAISELMQGLRSEKKDVMNYRGALALLRDYAFTIGDRKLNAACIGALEEHVKRYNANDVRLARTGVQDYLASHDVRFR
jgi:hypothetical protein